MERLLNEVLMQQSGRIKRFEAIAAFGYDAKDVLVKHCRVGDEMREDALARRFYSREILDHVHRAKALDEWSRMDRGEYVSLERGLGAFDMFVLHDEHGDLTEISELFDGLVARLKAEYPNLDNLTPRLKASKALEFLRSHDYLGLSSESGYRDLQNNYIGIALQDPEHPSLPLISVAIYCGVAQRLGLDAQPCGFPSHVHAIVYLPSIATGSTSLSTGERTAMYLDPFRSAIEVPVEHLHIQLSAWGIRPSEFHRFTGPTSAKDIVIRTSRNILATVHDSNDLSQGSPTIQHPRITIRTAIRGKSNADVDSALYSAIWANFLLSQRNLQTHGNRETRSLVPAILGKFERHFPMDGVLIERYICPLYQLSETLRVVRSTDAMAKQVRARGAVEREKVKWRIGQVFRHKRYGYTAVIVGWDAECRDAWIADNGFDTLARGRAHSLDGLDMLPRGRSQSLYHALTPVIEDQPIRYIVEENIDIITPEEAPPELMGLAGRYFKGWDRRERKFVSNIRDEYPDD